MSISELKPRIILYCKELLASKIETLEEELQFLAEDIAEDTKSSAGDKYETSREMANIEKQKLSSQMALNKKSLSYLTSLNPSSKKEIQSGSLVETSDSLIFIGISLGIQTIDGKQIIIISANSPLAQALLGKRQGDQLSFNNQQYSILSIA